MEAPVKKEIGTQTVICMEHLGSHDEIGTVYHKLYEWAAQKDVKLEGSPFTVFLSPPSELDSQSARFEVCMPVERAPEGASGSVKVKTLPACTVASITVKGPYEKISAHYAEMLAWLSAKGWETTGPPREIYIKGPDPRGGDPEKFVTDIQFPIR